MPDNLCSSFVNLTGINPIELPSVTVGVLDVSGGQHQVA